MIGYADAVDAMYGMANTAWLAGCNPFLNYTAQLRFHGQHLPGKPPVDQVYGRVSTKIADDSQTSLATYNGTRKYTAKGMVYVQIFAPILSQDLTPIRKFAEYVRDAFRKESPDGSIWFTNQRIIELPPDDCYYPFLVAVKFQYETMPGLDNIPYIRPGVRLGMTRNLPVEALDGVRTTFTFTGLPANQNLYALVWNGVEQNNIPQVNSQLTLPTPPNPSDSLYCWF